MLDVGVRGQEVLECRDKTGLRGISWDKMAVFRAFRWRRPKKFAPGALSRVGDVLDMVGQERLERAALSGDLGVARFRASKWRKSAL